MDHLIGAGWICSPSAPCGGPTFDGVWTWIDRVIRGGVVIFMISAIATLALDRLERDRAAAEAPTLDAAAAAAASTARLTALTCAGHVRGTAFAVEGAMVTNEHLVAGADAVRLDDGRVTVERAVVGATDGSDLAALEQTSLPPLVLADSPAAAGDPVTVAGHPGGGPLRLRHGTVQLVTDGPAFGFTTPVLVVDVVIEEGFSGGPVLDASGEVVGVLAAVDAVTGLAIATPSSVLDDWLGRPAATVPSPCPDQLSD